MNTKSLKEMAKKKRVTWNISPVTRKVESKKLYNRKKSSHDREDDYGMGVFICSFHTRPSVPFRRNENAGSPIRASGGFHYGYGF